MVAAKGSEVKNTSLEHCFWKYGTWIGAASVAPENFLESCILAPTPDPLNHKLWAWGLAICYN